MSKPIAEQLMEHVFAPKELPEVEEPSLRRPREVKSRTTLWSGGVVSMKVPENAELIEAEELGIAYLRFFRSAKGGIVNIFVHGDDPTQWRGTKITARPEIKRKEFSDGQAYLYIDLHPSSENDVNCRLIILSGEVPEKIKGMSFPSVFRTPPPLEGAIIIGYRDE